MAVVQETAGGKDMLPWGRCPGGQLGEEHREGSVLLLCTRFYGGKVLGRQV